MQFSHVIHMNPLPSRGWRQRCPRRNFLQILWAVWHERFDSCFIQRPCGQVSWETAHSVSSPPLFPLPLTCPRFWGRHILVHLFFDFCFVMSPALLRGVSHPDFYLWLFFLSLQNGERWWTIQQVQIQFWHKEWPAIKLQCRLQEESFVWNEALHSSREQAVPADLNGNWNS